MIPTTVSSSPSTATAACNNSIASSSGIMSSTSSGILNNSSTSNNNNNYSVMIGIASLVLEGRGITAEKHNPQTQVTRSSITDSAGTASYCSIVPSNTINLGIAGRQSPKPSTSRAAISAVSGHPINITTNPYPLGCATATTAPLFINSYSTSTGSASSSAESSHQRWAQKICQLRQASPAASHSSAYERNISVEAQSSSGEPELVALAINESDTDCADYEIVHRVVLNRANLSTSAAVAASASSGSSSSSPSSRPENLLHSLQTLATTCLRVGGTSTPADCNYRYSAVPPVSPMLQSSPMLATTAAAAAAAAVATASPKFFERTTPPRFQISSLTMDVLNSGSSNGSGVQSPKLTWLTSTNVGSAPVASLHNSRDKFSWQSSCRIPIPATITTSSSNAATAAASCSSSSSISLTPTTTTKNNSAASLSSSSSTYPQQGPHCDQFLRKMGLAKGQEAIDAEDHFCDMSLLNMTCSRWKAYCSKMEAVFERGEPLCIEVYLGPVKHQILLEQWIITQKERVPPPTMTLPSLCSAIRSQLYFSQISAWCDLIKKSDKSIYDTGRIIFSTATGAAGDLATPAASSTPNASATPGTSPSCTSSSINMNQQHNSTNSRPRLHIFYRIKSFDSTACFNSKPNVHNFPNVNISENCSISVCLKSLPRINGGIPKVGNAAMPSSSSTTAMAGIEVSANGGAAVDNSSNNANGSGTGSGSSNNGTNAFAAINAPMETPRTSRSTVAASLNCDSKKGDRQPAAAAFAGVSTSLATGNVGTASSADAASVLSSSSSAFNTQSKQKCIFFIDDDELCGGEDEDDRADVDACEEDDTNSDAANGITGDSSNNSSFSSNANLSHREKQLLKYRKRMLKRDKKHRKPLSNTSDASCELATTELQLQRQRCDQGNGSGNVNATSFSSSIQPMEQGEEELSLQSAQSTQRSTSTYVLRSNNSSTHIEMISTGTQTQLTCCQQCGNEKALLCLKCTSRDTSVIDEDALNTECDEMDDSSSISSTDIIHTPRNKAEMLLQAIQRTPKAAKHKKQTMRSTNNSPTVSSTVTSAASSKLHQNNNHLNIEPPSFVGTGCQVCKRQKTQHNFSGDDGGSATAESIESSELAADEDDDDGDGKGDDVCDITKKNFVAEGNQPSQFMEEESFFTSTKLTPQIDRCSLSNCALSIDMKVLHHSMNGDQKRTPPDDMGTSKLLSIEYDPVAEFKTPTNMPQQQQHHQHQPHKQQQQSFQPKLQQTPIKPNLLQLSCNYHDGGAAGDGYRSVSPPLPHHNHLLLRKGLPKVNLTPIFCNPAATATLTTSLSSPIPINNHGSSTDVTFTFDPADISCSSQSIATNATAAAVGRAINIVDNNNIPVQKSVSAPTLPNSPSLSPRFAKQAAIYKRRSRHLSDRSDRSSLGSDEQFSDEDFESSGLYSPATSPMKSRSRIAAVFGRQPLLGNLEESLLQKRLMPKVEVMGFKMLLGASGGFCPTQLTIAASAYFYELHGEALSTPYVCDVRLPRKGYSVPRAGTVQATLLNPMGTVVRMFVVPYDMRDMPPMHQTFIRQRILAEASNNETMTTSSSNMPNGSSSHVIINNNNNNNNISNNGTGIGDVGGGVGVGVGFTNGFECNDSNSNHNNNNNHSSNNNNQTQNKYRVSPNGGLHGESNLGHFISAEHMKRLRYSIHLRFQTSRTGRLLLHTDIRLLISRRTDCDTAAAHAKGVLEAPNDLVTDTVMPTNPKYCARHENSTSNNKI